MSFDQLTSRNKLVVDADSFRAQSLLRPMSRRHLMSLSVKATEVAGLASNGLFDTTSVYAAMQDNRQALPFANAPVSCSEFDPNIAWFDEEDHLSAYCEVQENGVIPSTYCGDIQCLAAEREQVDDIVAVPEGVGR